MCFLHPAKVPTSKPSHIYPLVSSHICLQITKDVRSQRLIVCHHSAGLSTKKENKVGFGINVYNN
jgi:hypothetical protein